MAGDLVRAGEQELTRWDPPSDQLGLRDAFVAALRQPEGTTRAGRPGHLTASLAIVDPQVSRILLIHHRKVGRWLQPGGHCEPGDVSLAAAALREGREETGVQDLRLASPHPLDLDVHRAPCTDDPSVQHLDVRFLGLADSTRGLDAQLEEVHAARWFGVDDLPPDLDEATARLVRLSLVG